MGITDELFGRRRPNVYLAEAVYGELVYISDVPEVLKPYAVARDYSVVVRNSTLEKAKSTVRLLKKFGRLEPIATRTRAENEFPPFTIHNRAVWNKLVREGEISEIAG